MTDVVLIPTFDRPEMLWLCLDHLAASPDSHDIPIWVYVDAHMGQPPPPREEIEEVLGKFPGLSLRVTFRTPHGYHGNSFNVLMAYRAALQKTDARYVFMVEDDVMIHPDFFAWHRQQHAEQQLGCSIGVVKEPQHSHYASLGVCFRREILWLIAPHCVPAYFSNLRGYCRAKFPPSKVDCEQDGLFCRVLAPHKVVYARNPVAQHVGWYGYHRKKSFRPEGNLNQRYAQVKIALRSQAVLDVWSKDFRDVRVLSLQ